MDQLTSQLEELGVQVDAQLFDVALTHRSFAYENAVESNERLEFLGDAVLQIVVTEHIFRSYPGLAEGQLAKLRASVVNTQVLADIARELGVGASLRLGRGEVATGGADKSSILADTVEAIIGAIHISAGREAAARFIHSQLDHRIESLERVGEYTDIKTLLQELCAAAGLGAPVYRVTGSGPDHAREFSAVVEVAGVPRGAGRGTTKKRAEQEAAGRARASLGRELGHA